MEMRALLVACLAAVLYMDITNSLMCYTCTQKTSNDECLTTSQCVKNETACITTIVETAVGTQQQKLINKSCISNCSMFQDIYNCCNSDKCNHNNASGMGPPIAVLGTAVLVSVTSPLLWTGL